MYDWSLRKLVRFILLILIFITSLFATKNQEINKTINNSAVAFIYHRFGESQYPSTNITLKQFKTQLDYLEEHNYNVWSLSRIVHAIKQQKPIPPKTVSLTIDDAYFSVYTNAYPMLKAKGYPFTVFVNTDPIDKGLKTHVTWDQIREMQKDKGEFFNHSLSHDYLLKKQKETQKEAVKRITNEIVQAQKRLDKELGENRIKLLAYPFGEYDLETKKIVENLGMIGVTQTSGPLGAYSDLQALTRFPISESFASMKSFVTKLNTIQFPLHSVSLNTPELSEKNPPLLEIKLQKPISRISCFLSSGKRIDLKWIDEKSFKISAPKPLHGERERYTCTAPAKNGKWYWYSHLFIIATR